MNLFKKMFSSGKAPESGEIPAEVAGEFQKTALVHLDALYGMALSLTRNSSDAQDLVQETCLKALKSFHRFERGTNIKAWLFTILRNSFINHYRKKKRTGEHSLDDESGFSFYAEAKQASEPKAESLKDQELLDPQKMEFVLGDEVSLALEKLPDDFREVLFLCDIQEMSYQEIATLLDIPIGTVRSRLARARGALQKLLWEYATSKGLMRRKTS